MKSGVFFGSKYWFIFLIVLLVGFFAGCKDDEKVEEGTVPMDGGTTIKPLALASATGCAIDSDCKAGLYCFQGRCAYDCKTDTDCLAGETCSAHGECTKGTADTASGEIAGQKKIGAISQALLDTLPGVSVVELPEAVLTVQPGQETVDFTLQLSGPLPPEGLAYTIERSDESIEAIGDGGVGGLKVLRAVASEGNLVVITIPTGKAMPSLETLNENTEVVRATISTGVGTFNIALMPVNPFAGHYTGETTIPVFGGVGLPIDFQVVTSPDGASLQDADSAWLLLPIGAGKLFSPVDTYEGAPDYIASELVYDGFVERWVATFNYEFRLGATTVLSSGGDGQIGRILRFEIEPFEGDKIIGQFSDRWEGFYDARSPEGIVDLVDIVFEGDLELAQTGISPKSSELATPPAISPATPALLPLPPLDYCVDFTSFSTDIVNIEGIDYSCGTVASSDDFKSVTSAEQALCAVASADAALKGRTTKSMLVAFLDDSVDNPEGMSFAEFMEACANGTDGTCVPTEEILCARQLLAYAYQNQETDISTTAQLVVSYQNVTQEAFLGRQLAAFKNDADKRLEWLKTTDYPAIVTSAVKDLNAQLLADWQSGVLDVHMEVLAGYFDPSGLAVLSRTATGDAAREARKQLLSEMIQAWRGATEALAVAAKRWDQLFQEQDKRAEKSDYVVAKMFDLYLLSGILTNLTQDSGAGYQAAAFGGGFSDLMKRAGRLSLSFDDLVFARDAEVVVSTSLDPESSNQTILSSMQAEAEMEIERAAEMVQTVLAESEAEALNQTELGNRMSNEINDLRTDLVEMCGLPNGCTADEFRTNPECDVPVDNGQCGFVVERVSGDYSDVPLSDLNVSEAGSALMNVLAAYNNLTLANKDLDAHNNKVLLEAAASQQFLTDLRAWRDARADNLTKLEEHLAAVGVIGDEINDAGVSTIDAIKAEKDLQETRMNTNNTTWDGLRDDGVTNNYTRRIQVSALNQTAQVCRDVGDVAYNTFDAIAEGLPEGSDDPSFAIQGGLKLIGTGIDAVARIGANIFESAAKGVDDALAKEQEQLDADLANLADVAAYNDVITDNNIAELEGKLEKAKIEKEGDIGALQDAYDSAKLERENTLKFNRDIDEFNQRQLALDKMIEDHAGLLVRIERAQLGVAQRIAEYLAIAQRAKLQNSRLLDLENQRADVNRLVGSPGVIFARANRLAQAETRLQRAKDKLMNWLVGLEYFAVRPFIDQRLQILLALNPYQLEDIAEELKRLESSCGGAVNLDEAIISVRQDLMGITFAVEDLATNEILEPETRFLEILKDGYVPIDKRVRYTTDATIGDLMKDDDRILSSTFGISLDDFANLASTCNAKIVSIGVQLIGELEDARPTVTVLYDGTSQLRSCQAGITEYVELIGETVTNFGEITMLRTPGRSISPLAGINTWRDENEVGTEDDEGVNVTLSGLPLSSQFTVLIDTKIGENATLTWDNLEDILLKVSYSYQDVFPTGQCE